MRLLVLEASSMNYRLWRNNCGSLATPDGRWVTYGVANPGGSDLIGIGPGGRFLAIEAKHGRNKPTREQDAFMRLVVSMGGLAAPVWSVEQFRQYVEGAQNETKA